MADSLWSNVLSLFNQKKRNTNNNTTENENNSEKYRNTDKINFTSIFSNKLATLAIAECDISITGNNARAEFLSGVSNNLWTKGKKIVATALGTGGCAIVPYVKNNTIYFAAIPQDRIYVNSSQGNKLTDVIILADVADVDCKRYYRWTRYVMKDNVVYITNKTTNASGGPEQYEEWKEITDISLSGVDRLPLAFLKCPTDNRRSSDTYGVPITYGCDDIIKKLHVCLDQIEKEFELKEARVIADSRMTRRDKDGKPTLKSRLFTFLENPSNDKLLIEFSPDIRESSFFAKLQVLYAQLEKAVGTSKGVLTDRETPGATATEIKAAQFDTYSIIYDIRTQLENVWNDYIYACDALCNAFNLCPQGKYDINYDWSYSWLESSTETWQQMKEGQSIGIRSKAELRAYQTGETIDEAQKAIDKITANEPNYDTLVGG